MTLGKFVIPNPFGPYEEPRFTHYLMKCWFSKTSAVVSTPSYVRDNIHVSLLAKAYASFAAKLADGVSKFNPSGYVETQGAFTARVADEMQKRLKLPCHYELKTQTEYAEPRIYQYRLVNSAGLGWSENKAWDAMADYYAKLIAK